LNIIGEDPDVAPKDRLSLILDVASGDNEPEAFEFTAAVGEGPLVVGFKWKPTCAIFELDDFENNYVFTFRINDNRCLSGTTATLDLKVTIGDVIPNPQKFIPPNIITPNGDGCNDFFAFDNFDPTTTQGCSTPVEPNLPFDNCKGVFSSVRVFNRWGKMVYETSDRKFRWYASDQAAGVYYYSLKFSDPQTSKTVSEYKGTITVQF
jgi:hypothetical protein